MEAEHRRAIGRPRSIDREKIVAAAHRLGLEKLTMRAVAAELGVTTQALYNHIGGRRELLVLLANDYSELFELDLDEETATWRGWLTEFARSLRTHLRTHSGLAASVVTQGPATPAALRFVERTVAKLGEGGFTVPEALRAYRVTLEFVVGWCQHNDLAPQPERLTVPDAASPLHEEIVAAWAADDDELFGFGLAALLEGLDAARTTADDGRRGRRSTLTR
ncbi:MAG: TetR/AcrR family transcriptional regulator C-terminal domain-containing protein [Acidimicrobiales bacterium]